MTLKAKLENISIVLVQPQIPENIGSSARAMANMGIKKLLVVNPKNLDMDRILKPATGYSAEVVKNMEVHGELKESLRSFNYVIGTTARTGSLRPALTHPRQLANELVPLSQENMIAIVFGPEDCGLSNEELKYCNSIATIPTADFWSINLAQAVLIICYEIFMASSDNSKESIPRLANRFELEGMYDHLQSVLTNIGYLNPQNPEYWLHKIRRFFSRLPLRAGEVHLIRGICRKIDWYTSHMSSNQKKEE